MWEGVDPGDKSFLILIMVITAGVVLYALIHAIESIWGKDEFSETIDEDGDEKTKSIRRRGKPKETNLP